MTRIYTRQLIILAFFGLLGQFNAGAQGCGFDWNYIGPDTLFVGDACIGSLDWGHPNTVLVTGTGNPNTCAIQTVSLQSISDGYSIGDAIQAGQTVSITYSAINLLGQTSTFGFSIYFADKQLPNFVPASLPPNLTITCAGLDTVAPVQATDNCSFVSPVIITHRDTVINPSCSNKLVDRIFKATDAFGNFREYTQHFSILPDNQPPMLTTAPSNITISCSGGNPGQVFQNWLQNHGGAVAVDVCSAISWSTIPATPQLKNGCGSASLATFVATDLCGNAINAQATFFLLDTTAPVIIHFVDDLVHNCNGTDFYALYNQWINTEGNAVITDNCTPSDSLKVLYIVNQGQDTLMRNELDSFLTASLRNSCDTTLQIGGLPYNSILAFVRIQFAFLDFCGNSVKSSGIFAVRDLATPIFTSPAGDTIIYCASQNNNQQNLEDWADDIGGGTVADDCGFTFIRTEPPRDSLWQYFQQAQANSCGNTGSLDVKFYVRDKCGNENPNPSTATFTIADTLVPTFEQSPLNKALTCSNGAQDSLQNWINAGAYAVATDFCSNVLLSGFSWQDDQGNTQTGVPISGPFPQITVQGCNASLPVQFNFSDDCGNTRSGGATFFVNDSIAPIITQIPANVTVQCDQIPSPENVVATDNCDGNLTQTVTDVSTQGADSSMCSAYNFVIERKYTISDGCGNSANQTQLITVEDQHAPIISGLIDTFNIVCNGSNPLPQPVITDCDPNPELQYSETSSQDPDPDNCGHYTYTVIRNWIYTDVCGNSSSFDQLVQVTDNLAPTFNLPTNITVDCETLNAPGFNGNIAIVAECDPDPIVSFTDHKVPGVCPGNYFLERLWTLTDACGNSSSRNQLISVRDTSAPKIVQAPESPILECVEASTIQQMYADWLDSYGNSIAEEPCGPVLRFKALPGSYDPQNSNTFPGQAPGNLVTDNCPSLVPGILTSKTVDFVFYDSCLNVTVRQATFTVIDTTAPEVVLCVSNIELANDPGLCSRDVILTPPQINDACLSSFATDTLFAMTSLLSNLPGNSDTIVNPATLSFAVTLPALGSFIQPTLLSIELIKADAEHPEEYMNVYGEDDIFLGKTNQANTQCGNSVTQLALDLDKLVAWAADGQILIHLRPNIPGALAPRFGINDICGGTLVKGEIQYQFKIAQGIRATVQIDSGAITVVNFDQALNINFPVGLHTVNYWISDCSGNTALCMQNWTIEDREKPEVDCPSDINLSLGGTTCDTMLTLPFPTNYTDNCGYPAFYSTTEPSNADDALLHFIQDPNLGDYLPDNKTITFTGVPNDIDGVVHLQFEIRGDIDSLGEYFTILGEGGSNLGTTEIGQSQVIQAGNCNQPSIVQFNIPPALFKSWAGDGIVSFQVIPKTDFAIPPGGPGTGINPCDTVLTAGDGYDLRSYVYAKLSFNRLLVDFYTTGATIIPLTALGENGAAPVYSFNAGITEVVYLTKDQSGNVDSCQFVINLNDPIPPVAICKSATIFVNPSGVEPYILDPSEVDGGSFDNCAIIKYEVTPNQFECNQFGQEIQVTLQVTDGGGNTSTCNTMVKIATETLMPSYTIGICEADTFQLFANAPYPSSGGNPYSFAWVGPNNFSSTLENPIIPNVTPLYSGSYTLTITGFGGCMATGSVDVVINTAVNTPGILVDEAHVCVGTAIHLTTTNYSGAVTYTWYSGVHPNGTQIAVTQSPELYTNLSAGNYFFYVIASQANCISNPSISINVMVIAKPLAMVVSNLIKVCEGAAVTLNSSNSGPGITYTWSGPAGFTASVANPLVSNTILPFQAGIYVLFLSEFGCQSNPVQVQVDVHPKPAKPILATSGLACEDQALIFSVNNISGAEKYFWIHPDGTTTITSSNTLSIPNLTLNDAGAWAVYVEVNGCRSDESIPFSVVVNPKPLLVPFNNGPVCVGDSIQIGTNIISGASYAWDGPNNFHSNEAQYQIIAVSGQYTVTITTQVGCKYDGSTQVEVKPIPSITAISNTAGDCATGSKDFQLIANIFPIEPGYMFFWTGPNGYLSSAEIAIIANGNAGDNGIYKLYVKNAAGCKSLVDSTEIKVKDAPSKPSIGGDPTLCIGDPLILQTQDYGPGTVYYWFTPTGVDSTINNATYTLQNANVGNSGAYGVAVVRDGCQSDTSSTVIVFVYPIPSKPIVSSDPTICEGDTLFLNTGSAPNAVFEWQGPNLYTSDLQNPYIFPVMLQNAGFYTVRIISNECGSELSDPYQIIINARPAAPSIQVVSGAICADDPSANLVLCIDPGSAISGGVYSWYQASSNTLVGGPALGLCNTIDSLNLLPDGINEFVAITELSGCASLSSIPVQVLIHNAPDVDSYAGTDDVSCGSSSYVLTADPIPGVDGKWTALQSQTQIQDLNNPITEVSNLQVGENRFLWSISYKGCPVFSTDTVRVKYEPQPTANDDIVNISFGGDLLIPILNNDIYSGLAQIEILRFPTRGNLSLQNASLFYESISNFAGEDTAVYRICSVFCPNMCDTAMVILHVGDASSCEIPNVFTPNEDGFNDVFFVPCLSSNGYPNNKVTIFNEWGAEVFRSGPYQNDWKGTFKGNPLPAGTYFYFVEFGNGDKPKSGYLVLKR